MGIRSSGRVLVAAALALAGCGSDSPTEPSFFRAEDIVVGEGNPAIAGDNLTVHYIGALEGGQVFESSYDRGEPYSFRLGARTVIQGWDQGLVGIRVGGKRRLTIPPLRPLASRRASQRCSPCSRRACPTGRSPSAS